MSFTAASGGDPHILCFDGSRIDLYDPGFYHLFGYMNEITVNAEICRKEENHEDYYNQIWIKCRKNTFLLIFTKDGIRLFDEGKYPIAAKITGSGLNGDELAKKINNLCGSSKKVILKPQIYQDWNYTYVADNGISFNIVCEAKYNTLAITTNAIGIQQSFSGIFVADVVRLDHLRNDGAKRQRGTEIGFYKTNAIIFGSFGPYIITTHRQKLNLNDTMFRLIQLVYEVNSVQKVCIINAKTDKNGNIRQLNFYMIDRINGRDHKTITNVWLWIGNHWELTCINNGKTQDATTPHEQQIVIDDNVLLLRIQPNGSVSCASKDIEKYVPSGAFFGSTKFIKSMDDMTLIEVIGPSTSAKATVNSTSTYEKLLLECTP